MKAGYRLCVAVSRTSSFYHGARGDTGAERPKEVVLEDCSSDKRKRGLQFLVDNPADSPPEECETLRASRCVARSQPLDQEPLETNQQCGRRDSREKLGEEQHDEQQRQYSWPADDVYHEQERNERGYAR